MDKGGRIAVDKRRRNYGADLYSFWKFPDTVRRIWGDGSGVAVATTLDASPRLCRPSVQLRQRSGSVIPPLILSTFLQINLVAIYFSDWLAQLTRIFCHAH